MEPIIQIKNVGKSYTINSYRGRYVALRDIIADAVRNPFASLKNKFTKGKGKSKKEKFWALRNINLDIQKGEVVGIIGANGAGKSTLLKILTGITPPTEGEIIMHGRVASLLEVGTGFHPELTGRENVYLNGAIMGMKRGQIEKNFDSIVEFSGIGQFIDTPVKRYSSGMYVRLAFSVAAHLDPDILLVDEVLAVGDAEFQKKCLGKMSEVTSAEGRTILFVSHNMAAIEKLCKKSILLRKGQIVAYGESKNVIGEYMKNQFDKNDSSKSQFPFVKKDLIVHDFSVRQNDVETELLDTDKSFNIEIDFEMLADVDQFRIGVYVRNSLGDILFRTCVSDWRPELERVKKGRHSATLQFPEKILMPGNYFLTVHASRYGMINYMENPAVEKIITVGKSAYYNQAHPTEKAEATLLLNQNWLFEPKQK